MTAPINKLEIMIMFMSVLTVREKNNWFQRSVFTRTRKSKWCEKTPRAVQNKVPLLPLWINSHFVSYFSFVFKLNSNLKESIYI